VKLSEKKIRSIINQEIVKRDRLVKEQSGTIAPGTHPGLSGGRVRRGETVGDARDRRRGGTRRSRSSTRGILDLQGALKVRRSGVFDQATKLALISQTEAGYKPISGMPSLDDVIGTGDFREVENAAGEMELQETSGSPAQWSQDLPYAAQQLGYGELLDEDVAGSYAAFIRSGYGPNPSTKPELYRRWLEESMTGAIEIVDANGNILLANPQGGTTWIVTATTGERAGQVHGEIELDSTKTAAWSAALDAMLNGTGGQAEADILGLVGTRPPAGPVISESKSLQEQVALPSTAYNTTSAAAPAATAVASTAQVEPDVRPNPAFLTYTPTDGRPLSPWKTVAADSFAQDIGSGTYTGAAGSDLTIAQVDAYLKKIIDEAMIETVASFNAGKAKYSATVDKFDSIIDGYTTVEQIKDLFLITYGIVENDSDTLSGARLFNGLYAEESWDWGDVGSGLISGTIFVAGLLVATGVYVAGGIAAMVGAVGTGGVAAPLAILAMGTATAWFADYVIDGAASGGASWDNYGKTLGQTKSNELAQDIKFTAFPLSKEGELYRNGAYEFWNQLRLDQAKVMDGAAPTFKKSQALAILNSTIAELGGGGVTARPLAEDIKKKAVRSAIRSIVNEGLISNDFRGGDGSGSEVDYDSAAGMSVARVDRGSRRQTGEMDPDGTMGRYVRDTEALLGMASPDEVWNNRTWRAWAAMTGELMQRTNMFTPDERGAITSNWQGASPGVSIGFQVATTSGLGDGRGYSPNAYGAFKFLTDLKNSVGEGAQSSTRVGGEQGGITYNITTQSRDPAVTQKLGQIGSIVASSAKAGGIVGINIGAVSIRLSAEKRIIPIVDRRSVKRRIRALGLPDNTEISIELTDRS
jgi:hypothetical protein